MSDQMASVALDGLRAFGLHHDKRRLDLRQEHFGIRLPVVG